MRYTRDDDSVTVDGEAIAATGAAFWGRSPSLEVDGTGWSFRIDKDGMRADSEEGRTMVMERGAPWRARSRMAGPSGRTSLHRTTSWWFGSCASTSSTTAP